MSDFLSIGGGAATDDTPKTTVLLDAMSATTGWTCYVGITATGWTETPSRMGAESHAGPVSDTWMYGFTGFEYYTTTPNETGCRLDKTFSATDITTINNIGFWVGFEAVWQANSNPAKVYVINLYLGSDGDATLDNSVVATYTPTSDSLITTSVRFIPFDRSDFTVNAGAFDWSNMQDVRIEFLGSAGTIGAAAGVATPWIYFQGLQINHYYKPTVVIGHDDGPAGYYRTGKAISDSFGYKTIQYLYPEDVEAQTSGVMTLSEVTELYNQGHDIALHATYSGDVLNTMTLAEIDADIKLGTAWQDANGFTRAKHCASYPQGVYVAGGADAGDYVYDTFVDNGIICVRGSKVFDNFDEWSTTDKDDSAKNNKNMQMKLLPISASTNLDTVLKPALNRLYKYGGVLVLNFHNVLVSGAVTPAIDAADYKLALQVVKDFENKGLLQVKTMSQVIDASGNMLIAGG